LLCCWSLVANIISAQVVQRVSHFLLMRCRVHGLWKHLVMVAGTISAQTFVSIVSRCLSAAMELEPWLGTPYTMGDHKKKNQQSPWTGSYRYMVCSLPPPPPPPTSNINNNNKAIQQHQQRQEEYTSPKSTSMQPWPVCRHTGYYGCISPITGRYPCCWTGTNF
jgi:hypothetical protein